MIYFLFLVKFGISVKIFSNFCFISHSLYFSNKMHWYNVPKNTSRRKVFTDALILFISITNKCLCNNAKEYCNFIKCYYNYNIKQKKTKTKNKKRITITIKNITNLWDQENSAVCMYISKEFFLDYLLIIY